MASARVYLVDDNDGFRDSTAWLLETAGFEPRDGGGSVFGFTLPSAEGRT